MAPSPLVRNFARFYGILWGAANIANLWKIVSGVAAIKDPYERIGYVGFGLVLVVLIFYCAFQVVALKARITLCLKILLAVSFLPVLMRGIVPLELGAWVLFGVLPTRELISAFSKK